MFSYSDQGDLIAINYTNGNSDVYCYDRFNLLCGYYTYGPLGNLLSGRTVAQDWNGIVTATNWPENRTNELHYDLTGGLVFSRQEGALPLYLDESSKTQKTLLGDEVGVFSSLWLQTALYKHVN